MPRRSILFAAGGSGGHLFPAIAVAEELHRRASDFRIGIVASEKEIDRSILARYPFERYHLASISPGRIFRQPWTVISENWHAWQTARQLIREQAPAVVIGCGGFASVPLVFAAIRAGVPVILLEQNLIPGRANVWLSRWATRICLSFEETLTYLPTSVQRRAAEVVTVTGNPVRRLMLPAEPVPPRLPNQLLILGGSQGARHLNQAIVEWVTTLPDALEGWTILHQTGVGDDLATAASYLNFPYFCDARAVDFITDPAPDYRSATLVIARAGATTLAELACLGAPIVLVPLPTAARDHQTANARWYAGQGAARLVTQAATTTETARQLAEAVTPLLSDPSARQSLSSAISQTARRNAGSDVAKIIADTADSSDTD
jgi:UDP-N-acetylglucosamine--N-acetylmuramyl-(pentapeptide) pyrophosphoryl-undecaprenol N-acetylglucosamine transferase